MGNRLTEDCTWKAVIVESFDVEGSECETRVEIVDDFIVLDCGEKHERSFSAHAARALAHALLFYADEYDAKTDFAALAKDPTP